MSSSSLRDEKEEEEGDLGLDKREKEDVGGDKTEEEVEEDADVLELAESLEKTHLSEEQPGEKALEPEVTLIDVGAIERVNESHSLCEVGGINCTGERFTRINGQWMCRQCVDTGGVS